MIINSKEMSVSMDLRHAMYLIFKKSKKEKKRKERRMIRKKQNYHL